MSVIYTDLTPTQQAIQVQAILATAQPGECVVFQGPNQLDQTWYKIIINKDGVKLLDYFMNLD